MLLLNRHKSSGAYRYGFNGMELDNELKGLGNSYDFGARMYDARIGRWFKTDDLEAKYSYLSPYAFSGNSPILFQDFDGRDFGIKIDHKNKTIVFVSNIYTTSNKAYEQAQKGAKQWIDLNKKAYKASGYTVKFEINVQQPLGIETITDEEVINKFTDVEFYKGEGEKRRKRESRIMKFKKQLLVTKAKESAEALTKSDDIGNLYSGNKGDDSKTFKSSSTGEKQKFVGGVTRSNKKVSMNTHPDFGGDLGSESDLVAHEIGHLFGLDDKGKGSVVKPYYSANGIMVYKGLVLDSPSLGDVLKIIQYANDFLSGKTTDGNVKIIEEKGENDGTSPIKTIKKEGNEEQNEEENNN